MFHIPILNRCIRVLRIIRCGGSEDLIVLLLEVKKNTLIIGGQGLKMSAVRHTLLNQLGLLRLDLHFSLPSFKSVAHTETLDCGFMLVRLFLPESVVSVLLIVF